MYKFSVVMINDNNNDNLNALNLMGSFYCC